MHDQPALILTALMILLFGLFSLKTGRYPVTGPMVFVLTGILLGPLGINLFEPHFENGHARTVAEITLIVILFTDASMIHFRQLFTLLAGLPARLLLIGLPLTVLLGVVCGVWLLPSIDTVGIILLALVLAPTDAALGQAVIKSPHIPKRIRESLSIESGLNDGIALPPILIALAFMADGGALPDGIEHWVGFTLEQLTLGPIVGGAIGYVGGRLVDEASRRGWMEQAFQRLSSLAIALLAFAAAEQLNGNGFIAAFFAGLLLGAKTPVVRERIEEFAEAEGQLLSLFVFLIFGLVLVPFMVDHIDFNAVLYSILSLTVIRMLPVFIASLGSGYRLSQVAFIGWFGPRGIASILYLFLVVSALGIEGYEYEYSIVILTVLISTFVHGASAVPFSRLFSRSAPNSSE